MLEGSISWVRCVDSGEWVTFGRKSRGCSSKTRRGLQEGEEKLGALRSPFPLCYRGLYVNILESVGLYLSPTPFSQKVILPFEIPSFVFLFSHTIHIGSDSPFLAASLLASGTIYWLWFSYSVTSLKKKHNVVNCSFYLTDVEKVVRFLMVAWGGHVEKIF